MMMLSSENSSHGGSNQSHCTQTSSVDADAELVLALLSGDRAAADRFARLYEAFIGAAVLSSSYAARRFHADLVQDVYVHLWRNDFRVLRQWEGERSLRAYLRTVIRHLVWERLSSLQPAQEQLEGDPMTASSGLCESMEPPLTPEQNVLADEVSSAVRCAIDALKPSYREALYLRYFRELSYAEIARTIKITPTNVGVRLKRALASMKTALCEHSDLLQPEATSKPRLTASRNKEDGTSLIESQEGRNAA